MPETQLHNGKPLSHHVTDSLDTYFNTLENTAPIELYNLVLAEVEKPLLEKVMLEARGNQSKASVWLGISRSTLRKKLAEHGLA